MLLIVWIILYVSPSECSKEVIELTSHLLAQAFPSTSCNHYVGDSNVCIEAAMVNINMQKLQFEGTVGIDGYVVFYENFSDLELLFSENYKFLPYKRILVFTKGFERFLGKTFKQAFQLKGNDLIVVKGFMCSEDIWSNVEPLEIIHQTFNKVITRWRPGAKDVNLTFSTYNWKPNFEEDNFKIAVFDYPPYLNVYREDGSYGGIEMIIINQVTEQWSKEIFELPKLSWRLCRASLKDRLYDIGTGGHWVSTIVEQDLDSTFPYLTGYVTYLVPKPKLLPLETFVFQPLPPLIWMSVCIFVLVLSGLYHTHITYVLRKSNNYVYVAIDIFGILFLNSRPLIGINNIGRPVLIVMGLLSLLIATIYSAGFTTNLTAPKVSNDIRTFRDLSESSLKTNNPGIIGINNNSENPYKRAISNYDKFYDPNCNSQIYLGDVINRYVFVQEEIPLVKKRNLKLLSENYGNFYYALPLQKNSAFTSIFDKQIIRFVEHGLVQAWLVQSMYGNYANLREMPDFFSPYTRTFLGKAALKNSMLQGIFYALFIGCAFSTCIFISELLVNNFR